MKFVKYSIASSLFIRIAIAAPAFIPLLSSTPSTIPSSLPCASISITSSTFTSSSTALPTGFRKFRRAGLFASVYSLTEPTPSPSTSTSTSSSTSPTPLSTRMIRIRRSNSIIVSTIPTTSTSIIISTSSIQDSTPTPNTILARDSIVEIFHSPRISIKKGICFTSPSSVSAFDTSLVWAYNWSPIPGTTFPDLGLGFIPMLFDTNNDGWMIAAQKAIDAGAKHLLAFNEPDLQTQANVSPSAAAASWMINMEPFASQGIKLISPAVTNGPLGIIWMKEFLLHCVGCTIDGIAVHFYNAAANRATNVKYFYSYLNLIHNLFGLPLWLTEFSGSGTLAEQKAFFETVLPFLERSPNIMAYAAFGGNFVDSTGSLTELGVVYKNTV